MVSTYTSAAVNKVIDSLKVKCININTQYENDNNENESDDDNTYENENDTSNQKMCEWTGSLSEWKKHNLPCKYQSLRYTISEIHVMK